MFNIKITLKGLSIVLICVLIIILALNIFQIQISSNYANITKKPTYFGATYRDLNNDFFVELDKDIEYQVTIQGDLLISLDAANSITNQIQQIKYLKEEGCKVIFISPVESVGLNEVIKECEDAGIIVIAIDSQIECNNVEYSVTSDNYEAGVLLANEIISTQSEGDILFLMDDTIQSCMERREGFMETIKQAPQFSVVDSVATNALYGDAKLVVENALLTHDFSIVVAINDRAALGAYAALSEENHASHIYSFDGSPAARQAIASGIMEASVAQSPSNIANQAVNLAYRVLDDRSITDILIEVEVRIINQVNLHEFDVKGWD